MGLHSAGTRVGEWTHPIASYPGSPWHTQRKGRPTVADLVFADIVAAHRALEAMADEYPLGSVTA